jgi:Disaggregatase related/Pectate lyase superfamily protein
MGKTVYVSGDGSGDFNCDGKDDHIEINKALAYQIENPEHSVYFKGKFKYTIDSPLQIGNNVILEGDPTACITIKNGNTWGRDTPLIQQKSPSQSNPSKIIIRDFEIDGNYAGNSNKPRGNSYHTLMWLYYSDVEVCNMYLHDSHNDGLKIQYSNNVHFHDNRVYKLGHEAMYCLTCNNVISENNNIRTMTNTATRIRNTNHVIIRNNEVWTVFEEDAGGPGFQIERTSGLMNDIEVYGNNIHDTYGPGIWLIGANDSPYTRDQVHGVHIHDNTFSRCGTHKTYDWLAGIITSGFYDTLIENNVFEGNYGAGVLIKNAFGLPAGGTSGKYNTIVRNNEITGTIKMKCGNGGQGIRNETPSTHTVTSEGNYIYENVGGAYYNVSSNNDYLYPPVDEPDKPSYLLFECTESQIEDIKMKYPDKPILRKG